MELKFKIFIIIKMKINKNPQQNIYDSTHSDYLNIVSQRIFMIIVVIYLLVDLSERLTNAIFPSWIYAILFAGIALGLFMMAVSWLEKSIMEKLNK